MSSIYAGAVDRLLIDGILREIGGKSCLSLRYTGWSDLLIDGLMREIGRKSFLSLSYVGGVSDLLIDGFLREIGSKSCSLIYAEVVRFAN